MNDNSDHAKLDALVGAALKGLVESGASAEAIVHLLLHTAFRRRKC